MADTKGIGTQNTNAVPPVSKTQQTGNDSKGSKQESSGNSEGKSKPSPTQSEGGVTRDNSGNITSADIKV